MAVILAVKTVQPLLLQVGGKVLCAGAGAGQEDSAVFFLLILLQVFNQQLKATVIRIDRPGRYRIAMPGFQFP